MNAELLKGVNDVDAQLESFTPFDYAADAGEWQIKITDLGNIAREVEPILKLVANSLVCKPKWKEKILALEASLELLFPPNPVEFQSSVKAVAELTHYEKTQL